MGGDVEVSFGNQEDAPRMSLVKGEKLKLPEGEYHYVHAVGSEPVMYMYIYQNTTDVKLARNFQAILQIDALKVS